MANEKNGDGRPVNLPGKYIHRGSGAVLITSSGDEGVVQADALMQPRWQDAWYRDGDVPSRLELQEMQKTQEMKDKKEVAKEKKAEEAELATV